MLRMEPAAPACRSAGHVHRNGRVPPRARWCFPPGPPTRWRFDRSVLSRLVVPDDPPAVRTRRRRATEVAFRAVSTAARAKRDCTLAPRRSASLGPARALACSPRLYRLLPHGSATSPPRWSRRRASSGASTAHPLLSADGGRRGDPRGQGKKSASVRLRERRLTEVGTHLDDGSSVSSIRRWRLLQRAPRRSCSRALPKQGAHAAEVRVVATQPRPKPRRGVAPSLAGRCCRGRHETLSVCGDTLVRRSEPPHHPCANANRAETRLERAETLESWPSSKRERPLGTRGYPRPRERSIPSGCRSTDPGSHAPRHGLSRHTEALPSGPGDAETSAVPCGHRPVRLGGRAVRLCWTSLPTPWPKPLA
jgi:hypothetical protein